MTTVPPLALEHCRPLRGSEHRLDPVQMENLLRSLDGWAIDQDGKLHKEFRFANYAATLLFVNIVAALAEREDHHPDLDVRFGCVQVRYSTHDVGGLSRNDFIAAAKIEALAAF